MCACVEAGNGGGWEIEDTGEGKVTLVMELVFEYLMPETTVIMKNLINHGATIKIRRNKTGEKDKLTPSRNKHAKCPQISPQDAGDMKHLQGV